MLKQGALFTANLENISIKDIESFTGIRVPEEQRTKEGLRVDYKSNLPLDLGKYIAGFANTSGGLILIGIEEKRGIPQKLVGIDLKGHDIKTSITNIAYSTIDPPIIPEVGVSRFDSDPERGVVVVRVPMSLNTPHMYTKDSVNSIRIRINDRLALADLKTIEMLFQRKNLIQQEIEATTSKERDRVDLIKWLHGYRALTIIPQVPRKNMIQFNEETDMHFQVNKPSLVWLNPSMTLVRDGIVFRGEIEALDGPQEQHFSISENRVAHYSEILMGFEKGLQLERTIEVLRVMLAYAKQELNSFGYFGNILVFFRIGWIEGKNLTTGAGAPLSSRSAPVKPVTAMCSEITVERIINLDEIDSDLTDIISSIMAELCRAMFGYSLEKHRVVGIMQKLQSG